MCPALCLLHHLPILFGPHRSSTKGTYSHLLMVSPRLTWLNWDLDVFNTVCQGTAREDWRCGFSLGKVYFRSLNHSPLLLLPCTVWSAWMTWVYMVWERILWKDRGLGIFNLSNSRLGNLDQLSCWGQQSPVCSWT